jgi:hypothetical protein
VHDRENTIRARQEREKLEAFNPLTQEQNRSEHLQQELKHEQKTNDAKTKHGHRMGIAVGYEKNPTTEDRAPRAVGNCHWLTLSTRHRTNRALT